MTHPLQFECPFVAELPPPPPKPVGIYIVAAWYTGPGCRQVGGSWRLFPGRFFATQTAAIGFLELLNGYHQHRRVYLLK